MSFYVYEWDIHIVCSGTGGVRVTEVPHQDQCLPFRKSAAKVLAIADIAGRLEMISPSSRFRVSEVLEKFSDPMKILARPVP
jgi:hypothetical protein